MENKVNKSTTENLVASKNATEPIVYYLVAILVVVLLCFVAYEMGYKNSRYYRLTHVQCTTLPNFSDDASIPKIIWMTYHKKDRIPQKVYDNLHTYANDYSCHILDDTEGYEFITKHFSTQVSSKFVELNGAHKADLLRYCLLYVHGGIYIDIKTKLIMPVSNLITSIVERSQKHSCGVPIITVLSMISDTIYQGVIATAPKQDFFLKLIDYIVRTPLSDTVSDYLIFTRDFFTKVKEDCSDTVLTKSWFDKLSSSEDSLQQGLNIGKDNSYYFLHEKCSSSASDCPDGTDRYNLCCYIYDKSNKVIKTRYSDFPWN